ncbi:MAG: PAS domain S-box protein, partial [Lentisphaerae bacterium]|nr:PAS domain S-box protein [Lentisphaerota bacterium]
MSELKPQSAPTMRIEILPKSDREAASAPRKKIPKVRARTPVAAGDANFQELFQRVYDGAIIADFDGAIVDANQRILEFLETDRAGLERQGILGVISGSDAALLDTLRRNLEDNRHTLIQAHCLRHDGSAFPAEIAVSRLTLSGRSYLCFFVRDVTVRRKAEETLRQERNLLHTLIDNLPDLIYVKDTQSRFIIGNRAVARLLGVETPDCLLDKTDVEFFPRELADQYRADEIKVMETGVPLVEKEEPCVNALGRRLLLLTTKVPLRDSTGRVVGVV